MKKCICLCLIGLFLFAKNSWARHIYGGDFSMSAQGNNRYQVALSLYFDEFEVNYDNYETTVPVRIFAKASNKYITTINLPRTSVTSIVYDNKACAELRQLKTSEIRYSTITTLANATYNDPGGYFMLWERCCRNNSVTNIAAPGATGMAFTLEFPPIYQNNQTFKNSSPDFSLPNGDYICLNKPFKFDMSAKDADGDEMRYSLTDPVAGYTSQGAATLNTVTVGRWPYPNATWINGYSAGNAIRGSKPLSIDAKTGMLSVTASEVGLFAFAILIEEYRNGVRIGAVRREFQLPVVDCGKNPPPVSIIYKDEKLTLPAKTLEICDGQTAELFVQSDPNWAFQWQRNGDNLPNETNASIYITQPGDYQVIASFSKTCANDTISQVTKVVKGQSPPVKVTPTDTLNICIGDSAVLKATNSVIYKYEWLMNGSTIENQTANSLKVKQSGVYQVLARTAGVTCAGRDTVVVNTVPLPRATMVASKNIFCPNDSALLTSDFRMDEHLEWRRNGVVIENDTKNLTVKQAGIYRVRVYSGLCTAMSDSVRIQTFDVPKITFDSLLRLCYKDTNLTLVAQPVGGNFSGKGVVGNTLSIKTLGLGTNNIKYTIKTKDDCTVTANQRVTVLAIPNIKLPVQTPLLRGEQMLLNPSADSLNYQYRWEPPLYLTNSDERRPTANPPLTTEYKVTATSSNGCQNTAKTRIWVYDGLYIPNTFSPNADGQNDVWTIRNVDKYPNTEVYIYNRWGEIIFYQKGYKQPWDGTFNGKSVPTGVYSYFIDTHVGTELNQIRGTLTVLR